MIRFKKQSTTIIYATIALLLAAVFVFDWYTPLGVVDSILYFIPVVLSLFLWRSALPLAIAILASILIFIGYFISPPGQDPEIARFNREAGVLTIWVIAFLCYYLIRKELKVRKQEEELRRSQEELEERAAELELRNRELQDFTFITSHHLSEPLRKIQTFGTLLKERSTRHLNRQEVDYISRMTGAANWMRELLDAIIRYSRVDTRAQEFRPSKLNDIVMDSVADLKEVIVTAGAQVEVGPLPTTNGDSQQLRQLFQYLISNAVKYRGPETKPLVRVYGEVNKSACRIFVEDNGIGFDEKYLEKIFQPFQRLHGRNEYSGSGMGLAICRKIVRRHGGTITARSTPGKGSAFVVTLPACQEEATS